MNNKQKVAILIPPVLIGVMYPIFHWFVEAWGATIGWYCGLMVYWIIWGAAFPYLMIGKKSILKLAHPQKFNWKILLLVLFPLAMAALYKFIPGMAYQKPSVWIFILLVSTNLGNGIFEEVLWRGVYMELFPNNLWLRIVWPSIWFGLWHYVPGAAGGDNGTLALIIGSGLFGFYLSFLAKKTGGIWWPILAHVIGGFIMIL